MSDEPILDPATQRRVAVHLYNRTWDLLDLGDQRTEAQTHEMVDAAHASAWHWAQIGGLEQAVVGEWMISRVHASAGHGEAAVLHAQRAFTLLHSGDGLPDWLEASVQEGLARAHLAAGDRDAAEFAAHAATDSLDKIAEADDRELVASQLAELHL
ncbi:MAG TPA: hypothetical protein VFL59_10730 [Candidatus Nanopelagicales bacterium]|nr:hypothetical protein [Candidatus Nanopelagicales bacterium]